MHPAWTTLEEQARSIYNGEVEPGTDGDGNSIELPRVWHFEYELRPFFVIEMPAHLARTLSRPGELTLA